MDRGRRTEHSDRSFADYMSCVAPVDPSDAFEQKVGLFGLFRHTVPVSTLVVQSEEC